MEPVQDPKPVFLDPNVVQPQAGNQQPVAEMPPQTPQVNEIQKPKLRHKLSFLLPGVVVLGALVGGILITNWVLNNKQTAEPTPTPTPEPSLEPATPVPTIAPVVQIKTYKDMNQDFSFAYPDSFSAVECENGVRLFQSLPEDVDTTDICSTLSGGEIKVYYSRQPIVVGFDESAVEDVINVAGYDGLSIKGNVSGEFLWQVSFERERIYYSLELSDQAYVDDFNQLVESFKFAGDLTKDWEFYSNNTYRYQISYPSGWIKKENVEADSKAEAKTLEFRKDELDPKLGSLAIEADSNVEDANLTASEVISSTRNLQGWSSSPSLELRQIGGGTAQVLKGVFNGRYQAVIVIWYKNRLVQMVWNDEVGEPNSEILDGFLGTFRFI